MKKHLLILFFVGFAYFQSAYSQRFIPQFYAVPQVVDSAKTVRTGVIDSNNIKVTSVSSTNLRANSVDSSKIPPLGISDTDLRANIPATKLNVPNTVKYYLNGFGKFVAGNTDSVIEGATNLFYTDARAKAIIVDTVMKAFGFYLPTAADSGVVYEVRESAESIVEIRALVTGGTSGTLNATRTRSGTLVNLLTANGTVNAGTAFASAGTIQNGTLLVGDIIRATLRGVSGSPTEIVLQITVSKPH